MIWIEPEDYRGEGRMSVNKVILVGNLGRDPEQKGAVTILSVATTDRRKDPSTGEWAKATEWHRVVCFGRTAESAQRFLSKGRQVYVEGKIRTNKWTDKEGQERRTTEVLADNLTFLGSKGDAEPQRRNTDFDVPF
jgi:single-strand DNA-binding protein